MVRYTLLIMLGLSIMLILVGWFEGWLGSQSGTDAGVIPFLIGVGLFIITMFVAGFLSLFYSGW